MSLVYNVIVTLFFWTLLYPTIGDKYEGEHLKDLQSNLNHSLPLWAFTVSWLISDVITLKSHWARVVPFNCLYLLFNYLYSLHPNGKVTYWFLDWSDDTELAIQFSIAQTISAIVVHLIGA